MAPLLVFQKEVRAYAYSPATYVFIVAFVLLSGLFVFQAANVFASGMASPAVYFDVAPALLLVFVPSVGMRLWSEENRSGTLELLMTLPIRDWEAVVGKYLGACVVLFVAVGLTLPIPISLALLADPKTPMDVGPVVGGYLGILLTGMAYLAIASAVSATTRSQVVAFISSLCACFVLENLARPNIISYVPSMVAPMVEFLAIATHSKNLFRGLVDVRDLAYFASLVLVALFLSTRAVEARRWR